MRRSTIALASVLMTLAACNQAAPPASEPAGAIHSPSVNDAAIFFPTWSSDSRPTALVGGTLVARRGCLFLRTGTSHALALWEEGYSYVDRQLLDPAGQPVARVGDAIHGGGGYASDWGHAQQLVGEKIPTRCRPKGAEPFLLIYDVEHGASS